MPCHGLPGVRNQASLLFSASNPSELIPFLKAPGAVFLGVVSGSCGKCTRMPDGK